MGLPEVTEQVNKLGNAWEHFKQVNDERLSQIERRGSSDPVTVEKLQKLNNAIDLHKLKMEKLESVLSRPGLVIANDNIKCEEEAKYSKAFNKYLRKGIDTDLEDMEIKSLTTDASSGSYGGYLVAPNIQRMIAGNLEKNSIMRKLCSVQEISTSALDIIDDDNNFGVYWSTSETANVADTSNSAFIKKSIPAHELVAQPQVTQKLIDDSAVNVEEWLARRLSDTFLGAEESSFINGDGLVQPKGILNYNAGSSKNEIEHVYSTEAVDGDFNVEELLTLYYSLNERYVNRASFLTSRVMVQKIRTLKDANNEYIWYPGVLMGRDDTLLGVPLYSCSYIPAPSNESKSLILGDFSQYQIVDRAGIRILRDPFTSKPYIRFYTTKRVGGDVIRTEAFKVLVLGSSS